jgi:mannose/fructose/N-acetylgalactosamine-specific phosphotransferase system component IID
LEKRKEGGEINMDTVIKGIKVGLLLCILGIAVYIAMLLQSIDITLKKSYAIQGNTHDWIVYNRGLLKTTKIKGKTYEYIKYTR